MRPVCYAMEFRGQAESSEEKKLLASTRSVNARIESEVGPNGLSSRLAPGDGVAAEFTSEVTLTGDSSFIESGTIQFGNGHSLHFTTVGEGYMGPSPQDGLNHGTIMWRVDGGEGQFAGASGLITSNFTLSSEMEVDDFQFGYIWVE